MASLGAPDAACHWPNVQSAKPVLVLELGESIVEVSPRGTLVRAAPCRSMLAEPAAAAVPLLQADDGPAERARMLKLLGQLYYQCGVAARAERLFAPVACPVPLSTAMLGPTVSTPAFATGKVELDASGDYVKADESGEGSCTGHCTAVDGGIAPFYNETRPAAAAVPLGAFVVGGKEKPADYREFNEQCVKEARADPRHAPLSPLCGWSWRRAPQPIVDAVVEYKGAVALADPLGDCELALPKVLGVVAMRTVDKEHGADSDDWHQEPCDGDNKPVQKQKRVAHADSERRRWEQAHEPEVEAAHQKDMAGPSGVGGTKVAKKTHAPEHSAGMATLYSCSKQNYQPMLGVLRPCVNDDDDEAALVAVLAEQTYSVIERIIEPIKGKDTQIGMLLDAKLFAQYAKITKRCYHIWHQAHMHLAVYDYVQPIQIIVESKDKKEKLWMRSYHTPPFIVIEKRRGDAYAEQLAAAGIHKVRDMSIEEAMLADPDLIIEEVKKYHKRRVAQ